MRRDANRPGHPPARRRGSAAHRLLGPITAAVVAVAVIAGPASAVPTDIDVSPLTVDFGAVAVGTTAMISVQVTNTGADPFGPINIFGGAPPTTEFNASQNCQGTTLAAGASCTITYAFTPSAVGVFSDTSSFTISETANQADGENFSVSLAGTGCTAPCAPPTITSFTPTNGPAGTVVTINGTGFAGTTAVTFGGVDAATFAVVNDTQMTATVPMGSLTGPIGITTALGTVASTTEFTVEAVDHTTRLILDLRRHLIARGQLSSDLSECEDGVTVHVERKVRGHGWRKAGKDTTDSSGGFSVKVRDREGRYRVTVAEHSIGDTDTCLADISNRERHTH